MTIGTLAAVTLAYQYGTPGVVFDRPPCFDYPINCRLPIWLLDCFIYPVSAGRSASVRFYW